MARSVRPQSPLTSVMTCRSEVLKFWTSARRFTSHPSRGLSGWELDWDVDWGRSVSRERNQKRSLFDGVHGIVAKRPSGVKTAWMPGLGVGVLIW